MYQFLFFAIGFFTSSFIIAMIALIKSKLAKRKVRLHVTTLKDGSYKLTLYPSNHMNGKFFVFKEKEDLVRNLKKYPPNTFIEFNKESRCIEDIIDFEL